MKIESFHGHAKHVIDVRGNFIKKPYGVDTHRKNVHHNCRSFLAWRINRNYTPAGG